MAGVQHVVLFRFPTALLADDEAAMFDQVAAWPAEIGDFDRLRFGKNTIADSAYQYVLVMEFPDADALARYRPHPVHQAFVDWLRARGCEVVAADCTLGSPTVIHGA